eukprot:153860-Pleurochrysis_carterae.AAC.1
MSKLASLPNVKHSPKHSPIVRYDSKFKPHISRQKQAEETLTETGDRNRQKQAADSIHPMAGRHLQYSKRRHLQYYYSTATTSFFSEGPCCSK